MKRALWQRFSTTLMVLPPMVLFSLMCPPLWAALPTTTGSNDTRSGVDPELVAAVKEAASQASSFSDVFDAQVWLVDMSGRLARFVKKPKQRLQLLQKVHHYATQQQLPPELVLAVIEVESHFDRFAVSSAGAQGMMQIMPFWKQEIGRPQDNLTNVDTNLRYGTAILSHYLKRSKNRWPEALARYNGSYGRLTYAIKVMNAWENRWRP